jgi:two-component system response regulator QseB
MKIFLIEDDMAVGRALLSVLQDERHVVVWVRLAEQVCERIQAEAFDAVLLDLGLPDGDGIVLLRQIRAVNADLPVMVITSRDSLEDRLRGFSVGADDYLIKPFEIPELLARLRAVVRRSSSVTGLEAPPVWKQGDLMLDEGRLLVTRAGVPVALSRTEFALLCALMRQSDRVHSRAELEALLPQAEAQTLDVHVSNLRKKIGDGLIRTVRGVGYMVLCDSA